MFKSGSIRKITVTDFVTYSYAEMYPGPNLNMLIGPNGTGKSTIVAAIILGLGGSPKTVGRGTKISEYVKHNCSEATINIQLQGHTSVESLCITRHFDVNERSVWSLNGRRVTFKEIESNITQFNIQVDNLCQFLPQDRVQDFAKMNKQQLLQQTQLAVCRYDLIDKQLQLIQICERHKEFQASIEKNGQKLQDLQDANLRLEGKVKNLKKKKKYLTYIKDVERKIAWVKYDKLRDKMDEVKLDKLKAYQVLNKYKADAEPINVAVTNAKNAINDIQEKLSVKNREVYHVEVGIRNKIESCTAMKASITKALGDLNSKLREIEKRENDIIEITQQIKMLIQNKAQLLETNGDDAQRGQMLKSYNENLKQLSAQLNRIVEKKGEIENMKHNKSYELNCFQNELKKLENVRQQRLEWLRRIDKDAYTAVQWLRSNKNMFIDKVFEPMILELNVLNAQHAIFIENIIPLRDKVAFTCVSREDMNLLIRMLRDEQKLSVNIIHSGNDQPSLHSYQPTFPVEQLKSFGLFAYVRSLITGPEPLMRYLCKTYRIHNIPVGTHITNKYFDKVPQQITTFFSDAFRFTTSYSKYTGQKSTKQIEIKSDGSLAISLNAEHLESIKSQLSEVQGDCQKCDQQIHSFDTQIRQINEKQEILRMNIQEIQKCKQNIQVIESRIRVLQANLEHMQQSTVTRDLLQRKYDERVDSIIVNMIRCQQELKDTFKKYSSIRNETNVNKSHLDVAHKQMVFLENKAQDIHRLCEEAETKLRQVKESYANATNNAKEALLKAKQLSKGYTPVDDEFEEFREAYNKMPDNLQELEGEKDNLLSKIDCLNTADMGELQEYERRQQQIEKLQHDIQKGSIELDEIIANIELLRQEWLEPLEDLVQQINTKFSAAFQRMGCAGDVSIYTGSNGKDFAEYGLSIKVKYRDIEPLQELNSVVQSGGERAVATAAYMLSLQELTPVPFRCVDEINQGMDSNNERRIFELLVDTVSQSNTSQYFFITPKLVPNLKFIATMNIHIVHNGPFVSSQQQWNGAIQTSLKTKLMTK